MKKILLFSAILLCFSEITWGQTNPTAFDLSTGNFSFTGFAAGTTTAYPASMQGHKFAAEPISANITNAPSADFALSANSTGITTGSIRNEIANGISILNSSSNNLGAIVVAINTTGRNSIAVTFTAEQMNDGTTRINGLRLQYRIGTSGSFTDVTPLIEYLSAMSGTNTSQTFTNVQLPVTIENQSNVQVRWIYYSNSGSGNRDRIRLDDITISSSAPSNPIVTTQAVSSITSTTTTGNGTITNIGSANPTTRGFCWDLFSNPDPDLTDSHSTENGSFGTGAFTGSITGLSAETRYKTVAYATNSSGTGYGTAVNFWTYSTEPGAHTTVFNSTAISQTQIDLNFDAAGTIADADGYVILRKTGSAPTGIPVDGTSYTAGATIGDGTVAAVITGTAVTSSSITGLTAGNSYYFTIFPFNSNGTNSETTNYKTDGTIPGTNATTNSANDADSYADNPGSQANPGVISSLADTDPEAVEVYRFKLTDVGGDGLQTKVTQVTISAGAGNTATWTSTIQEAKLSADGGTSFITVSNTSIGASGITFTIPSTNLIIPNGTSSTLSLFIHLKNSGIIDGQTLQFSIPQASHGFVADATGSTFATSFVSAVTSNLVTIDVTGTKFIFSLQPANTSVNTDFSATVKAVDANGNSDLSATSAVTLSSSAGTLSSTTGLSQTLSGGLFAWTDLQNNTAGTGVTLSATGDLTTATSNAFKIFAAQPSTQASVLTFSNVTMNSMTLTWTNGDGSARIAVIKASSTVGTPADGNSYLADPVFGSGGTIATNEFVIYNGTGNSVTVTGLTASTVYYFKVFEYNGSAGTENYLTTSNSVSQVTFGLTYYSNGSGDPAVLTSWKTNRDGSGSSPANFTAGDIFVIESGDNMTTTSAWGISGNNSKVEIEGGGTLTANNAITLSVSTTFQIDDNGTYIHNNTTAASSTIFGGTESFGPSSNFRIDNWSGNNTSITTGVALPFGNLELNWTGNTANWQQGLTGTIVLCAGNLTVTSVGSGTFRFAAGTAPTITIAGNYTQNGGTVNLASTSGSSVTTLNLGGNFTVNNGTFTSTSTGSKVVFEGVFDQLFTNTGAISTVNFVVATNTMLDMGTQVMTGGSFTLNAGAGMRTAHPDGIAGSGATGCIQVTGTRTFSTSATYEYYGDGIQSFGTGFPSTIGNLAITGNNTMTLGTGLLNISGFLKIYNTARLIIPSAGQMTVGGSTALSTPECLVLKSDASGTASLIDNGFFGAGTILAERYLVPERWHYISAPVADAIANDFIHDYLKTSDPTTESGWSLYTIMDPSTPLEVMRGYACWKPASNTDAEYFSGTPNTGSQSITLNRTASDPYAGWHLVGNPYPSSIDLENGITWGNVENTAYFWDGVNGNYTVYPTWGSYGTHTKYCPPTQGFFVHIDDDSGDGNTTLTFTNASRVHNGEAFLKDQPVVSNVLLLSVSGNVNSYTDKAAVHFTEGTTNSYDKGHDARKLAGLTEAPQLYTIAGEKKLACNSLPFDAKNISVPLGFSCGVNGNFEITADSLQTFGPNVTVTLEDKKLNIFHDLKNLPQYSFAYNTSDNSDRFVLHFFNPNIGTEELNTPENIRIFAENGEIHIFSADGKDISGIAEIFDMTGRKTGGAVIEGKSGIINVSAATGYYLIRLTTGSEVFTQKIFIR